MTIRFPRTRRERVGTVVAPVMITKSALAEAEKRRRNREWRRSFIKAVAMKPLLVLGALGSHLDYYIVDFRTDGQSTGRMIFTADGAFGEIAGLQKGQSSLPPFYLRSELPTVLKERQVTYRGGKSVPFGASAIRVMEDLVWTPCDQSLVPLQPFYVVHWRGNIVYARVDGNAYGQLTEFVAGA